MTELPDLLEPSQFRGGRAGRRCIDTLLAKEVLRPAAQESHLQAFFAGATTSGSWSRGTMEVLRGALSDNKNPRFTGIFSLSEPSDGLEPSTPSLPRKFGSGTREHTRSSETQFLLQIGVIQRRLMRRDTSRVSFLMCPFCVRD